MLENQLHWMLFLDEKTLYERENQIDTFKARVKPIMGRSINDEEFANIVKLKNEKFEVAIKEKFIELRNKRIKAIKKIMHTI